MKIALDVMGGDRDPEVILQGARRALEKYTQIDCLFLVGDEQRIRKDLEVHSWDMKRVEMVAAGSVVEMDDAATTPLRKKKDSSIRLCADLVRDGQAQALVSAGNTGAAVAVTTVRWRMVEGVDRPGICSALPADHGHTHILDAGANVDAKVKHILAYGLMGSVYCQRVLGIEKPKIGLMSVGEEDHKGTDFTRECFEQLKQAPINFVGNVEGHDLFESGIDVIVCDGFTGNVTLKTAEATGRIMLKWLKKELTATPVRKFGALMAKRGFQAVRERGSYETVGGSPLLGVNGVCIIGHGSSNEVAIENAIRVAKESIEGELLQAISDLTSGAEPKPGKWGFLKKR